MNITKQQKAETNKPTFFDEERFTQEWNQVERFVKGGNKFLNELEKTFNITFQTLDEFGAFYNQFEKWGHNALIEHIEQTLETPTIGGFQVKKEAIEDVEIPDSTYLKPIFSQVTGPDRTAGINVWRYVDMTDGRLEATEDGKERLQSIFTVEASSKQGREYIQALHKAQTALNEAHEAAKAVGVVHEGLNRRHLGPFLKNGEIDSSAFYELQKFEK